MSNTLKYVKVYDRIFEMIQNKTFPPGSRLPAEKDLAEQMQVSRMTLRKALALLQEDNLICNKTGVGSFVNTEEAQVQQAVRAQKQNPVYACCVQAIDQVELDFRIEPPTQAIRKMLGQPSPVVVIADRWYQAQGRPCAYSLSFVPIEAIGQAGIDLNDADSLLHFLQEDVYKKSSGSSCTYVHSTAGNFTSAKYTLSEHPSFLLVQETVYGANRQVLLVSKHYIPIDLFKLEIHTEKSDG